MNPLVIVGIAISAIGLLASKGTRSDESKPSGNAGSEPSGEPDVPTGNSAEGGATSEGTSESDPKLEDSDE